MKVKVLYYGAKEAVEKFFKREYLAVYRESPLRDYLSERGFRVIPSLYFGIALKTNEEGYLVEIDRGFYSDKDHEIFANLNHKNDKGENLGVAILQFFEERGYPFRKMEITDEEEIYKFVKTLEKEGLGAYFEFVED